MIRFKFSFLLSVTCFLFYNVTAKEQSITLSEAIRQNIVTVTSVSSGESYDGNGLALKIENKSKKTLNVIVDPALLFVANDTVHQDFVVVGNISVNVESMADKNILLQTYCTKSNVAIPKKEATYKMERQADSNMIKVLAYAAKHKIKQDLTQRAVWVLTNHKDPNTVYDPSDDLESKNLALYLSLLLKEPIPVYYKYFELSHTAETAGEPVVPVADKKPLKIYSAFKWEQKTEALVSLIVYDAKGNAVQPLFERQSFKVGHYEFNAVFDCSEVDSGHYNMRLSDESRVLKDVAVVVD